MNKNVFESAHSDEGSIHMPFLHFCNHVTKDGVSTFGTALECVLTCFRRRCSASFMLETIDQMFPLFHAKKRISDDASYALTANPSIP